jgi:hypothetical protein
MFRCLYSYLIFLNRYFRELASQRMIFRIFKLILSRVAIFVEKVSLQKGEIDKGRKWQNSRTARRVCFRKSRRIFEVEPPQRRSGRLN